MHFKLFPGGKCQQPKHFATFRVFLPLIFSARFGSVTGFPNLDLRSAVSSVLSDNTSVTVLTSTFEPGLASSVTSKENKIYLIIK